MKDYTGVLAGTIVWMHRIMAAPISFNIQVMFSSFVIHVSMYEDK